MAGSSSQLLPVFVLLIAYFLFLVEPEGGDFVADGDDVAGGDCICYLELLLFKSHCSTFVLRIPL